ncbi:MAG TPA: GNAT family N-acetyltransferase [Actinomycetales bacterium]|nr:GNAT family N-acetyltransferase [Actinomycetales bacterium]
MDAPTLTGPEDADVHLVLRPHGPADVDAVVELCRDTQMVDRTRVPVPYTREHGEQFVRDRAARWADGSELTFAIDAHAVDRPEQPGSMTYAGNIALRPLPGAGVEVGFALSPWARGRGIMADALRTALRWSFDELDTQVVHWQAHVGNWPSRRVAWACGFRVEGLVRGLLEARGVRYDGWIGSLVRGEPMSPAHPWLEAPVIMGDRAVLRPWREEDAPRVVEACNDPVSQRWLPNLPRPYTLADAQWYIRSREEEHAQGSAMYWCVADPDDDRCLGSLGLMGLDGSTHRNEIGYWAHPDARGRGVMTQACRLALRHAVLPASDGGLGLERVTLRAATANVASNLVAQRAGFTRTGVARHVDRHEDGTFDDLELYDALADEVLAAEPS